MKKLLVAWLLALWGISAIAQPADTFVNNTILVTTNPPQIDAKTFINNAVFEVNLFIPDVFATANTRNYTNFGTMGSATGFRFDTFNRATARYSAAENFHNESGALIDCGGTNIVGGLFSTNGIAFQRFNVGPECNAWSDTIVNRGTIEMGLNGILRFSGKSLDLSGGLLNAEGFETGRFIDTGMFDNYWGVGFFDMTPGASFGLNSAFAPAHWITNRYYQSFETTLSASGKAYLNILNLGASNNLVQVVYLQNFSPSISNNVYFAGGTTLVEWTWPASNNVSGRTTQDNLFLVDNTAVITNLVVITNGVGPASTGFGATFIPTNWFFFRGLQSSPGTPASPGLPPGLFDFNRTNVEYSAYSVIFSPFTRLVYELAGQTYSNMPGRTEITASNQLDLTASRISALNYLKITATNNITIDPSTRILTPVADYDLGTTNGSLTVSNLLAPTVPRLNGLVSLFEARWTNTVTDAQTNIITNIFNVLVVNSQLESTAPALLQNLTLRSPNVFISDVLNVQQTLTVDAANLTITTNSPDAANPFGQLNFLSGDIIWTNSFPRLENLTNFGLISVQNVAFFGGVRFPPFYPTSDVEPYNSFVNFGTIATEGAFVWADTFINSGIFQAGLGPISIQAGSAVLENGSFSAPNSDITLAASDLLIRNQVLNAGRKILLWATNSLDDGGGTSANFWTTGVGGISLFKKPPTASLLGTAVLDTAPDYGRPNIIWDGTDSGPSTAGFANNAALGRLILDGGLNSKFIFSPAKPTSALYVDVLELRNFTTNRTAQGDLVGIQINPGMKIYFADAVINGISVAEKLNGKNGGFVWVPGFVGPFSGTTLTYPDGSKVSVNRALASSPNIDSNNNGIPNNLDPAPFFTPSQIKLKATNRHTPAGTVLSWNTLAGSTNCVLYRTELGSGEWQPLTNFVFGPVNGQATILDSVTGSKRYYRVRVDPPNP